MYTIHTECQPGLHTFVPWIREQMRPFLFFPLPHENELVLLYLYHKSEDF